MHESRSRRSTGKGNAETGRAVLANRAGPIAQGVTVDPARCVQYQQLGLPIENSIHVCVLGSRLYGRHPSPV
jgi:hypothetical protein